MEYRHLGRSGLKVSVYSFGAMTFGGGAAGIGETAGAEAQRQIDMCLDVGVNLFDTADVYANGLSEEVLAEALGARRNRVLIATKFFGRMGDGVNDTGASRHHIVEACEASLKRLKTDYIDLYQIHNQDLLTPAEETLRALDDLVRAGKVRYIGSSNHSGWTKMKALATSDRYGFVRYVSQQIEYNLIHREAENELFPLGLSEGVGALIWSPLAMGYLTGKFKRAGGEAETRRGDWVKAMDDERGRRIVDALEDLAAARPGATASQVALNWVARRAGVASIILGARTSEQLADNLAATSWSLRDDEIARLDEVSAKPDSYPYVMHRRFAPERNPRPSLLPPIVER